MPDAEVMLVSCDIDAESALDAGQQIVELALIPALTKTCADCANAGERARLLGGAMSSLVGLMTSAVGAAQTRSALVAMHAIVDALEADPPPASALH